QAADLVGTDEQAREPEPKSRSSELARSSHRGIERWYTFAEQESIAAGGFYIAIPGEDAFRCAHGSPPASRRRPSQRCSPRRVATSAISIPLARAAARARRKTGAILSSR